VKIALVVGARPNFMKVAPVLTALRKDRGVDALLIHTGQHYDDNMSDVFFRELGLPDPDAHLGVGSGSHAQQTARLLCEIETMLLRERPELVVVAGDVNSTLAAALVATKMLIPVAHIEAGLRSHDWTMPEEVNRVLTDRMSRLLFTPSRDADANLLKEGIDPRRIHFTGNAMIDTLNALLPAARGSRVRERLGLAGAKYALVTAHRPSNVDEAGSLRELIDALAQVSTRLPVIFPVHPRTRARLAADDRSREELAHARDLRLIEPVGYVDFLSLMSSATVVLTDSGGIQEETTALGVPCLTLRENTERPITIERGTNVLVGSDPKRIVSEVDAVLRGDAKRGSLPELWDGHAGDRIARAVVELCRTPGE